MASSSPYESKPPLLRNHPLQRLPSPSRGFSAFVHAAGLLCFAYSFRYLVVNPNPINASYGWHMQYLTIVGLTLATTTFGLGLLADITLSSWLFLAKNAMSVASAPLEVLISSLYWGLRAYDRRLVLPDWAMPIDLFSDLSFHLLPTVLLLLDTLLLSPPSALPLLPSTLLFISLATAYYFWVELCFAHNGFYPYPLLDILGPSERVLLFAACAIAMTVAGWAIASIYEVINGRMEEKEGPARKEKSL